VDLIRLLLIEDSEDDEGLILAALQRADLSVRHIRVDSEESLRRQLDSAEWDVVVTDFFLDGFDGLRASEIVRQHDPELPVLLLSGVLGEQRAIQAMRAGVRDFIDKAALGRLGVLIEREVHAARQRRVALDALSRARANARAVVQTLPVPLVIFDDTLSAVMANPSFRAIYTDDQPVEGWSALSFPFCQQDSGLLDRIRGIIEEGESFSGLEVNLKAPWREQDLLVSGERLTGPDTMALVTLQDITAQRTMERQLASRERLESLGRLAGGIAHDFNNILCIIQGHATLIEELGDTTTAKCAVRIGEAVDRAARLTAQLLAFSSQQTISLQLVDIGQMLVEMRPMVESVLRSDIALVLRIESPSVVVRAERTRLEQIVMNLVLNARDAMAEGGELAVSLEVEHDVAHLTVEDNGEGMTPEIRSRLFEPFFTTRPPAVGLGLATVHGIVEQLGARIVVQSTAGVGSRFTVTIPRVVVADEEPPSRTILLVEDEVELLDITKRMLVRRGYRILSAASADEALAHFQEHGPSIDLLLTDIAMPGMSGFELAIRLRAQRPGLPVVLVSGFYQNSHSIPYELEGALFIQKPFTWRVFMEQVDTLMRSS
jgi:signal transduction histidine kinase/DNA-binding response OmpR family regulator